MPSTQIHIDHPSSRWPLMVVDVNFAQELYYSSMVPFHVKEGSKPPCASVFDWCCMKIRAPLALFPVDRLVHATQREANAIALYRSGPIAISLRCFTTSIPHLVYVRENFVLAACCCYWAGYLVPWYIILHYTVRYMIGFDYGYPCFTWFNNVILLRFALSISSCTTLSILLAHYSF